MPSFTPSAWFSSDLKAFGVPNSKVINLSWTLKSTQASSLSDWQPIFSFPLPQSVWLATAHIMKSNQISAPLECLSWFPFLGGIDGFGFWGTSFIPCKFLSELYNTVMHILFPYLPSFIGLQAPQGQRTGLIHLWLPPPHTPTPRAKLTFSRY